MNPLMRFTGVALAVVSVAFALGMSKAQAAGTTEEYGSAKLQWKTSNVVVLTLTPNYTSGYGPTGGTGSGATPSPGPGASLDGGIVDFGSNVTQGYAYLYKYAVQAAVYTNDAGGFSLYAEGASNVNDNTAGGTIPINTTLYWLTSSSSNTPFSIATPFQATTTGTSCGTGCLTYPGSPAPGVPPATALIWNYTSSTVGLPSNEATQGYDYQLRLYSNPATDNFSVYIVYTAVAN
jgi:hypothetical protein